MMTKREVLKTIANYGRCEKIRCADCSYYKLSKHCLGSFGLLKRIGAMGSVLLWLQKLTKNEPLSLCTFSQDKSGSLTKNLKNGKRWRNKLCYGFY